LGKVINIVFRHKCLMRLIVVSNRLPVSVSVKNGKFKIDSSAGGVATGLQTYLEAFLKSDPANECLWVGWPGTAVPETLEGDLQKKLEERDLYPINLTQEQVEDFYYGFCNGTLWPLFHSFPSLVTYKQEHWAAYREVNELFAEKISEIIRPGDVVWVQDYQLMLLPKLLRDRIGFELPIGFFLHIPFPVFEIYRLLPDWWRKSLLNGMLGADLVGFHTYDYTQYFIGCVQRILGYEYSMDHVVKDGGNVLVNTYPIGIDFKKFNDAILSLKVLEERRKLKQTVGNQRIILSIDRLDYTKGIDKRLQAYEWFLEKNPEFRGKVVLIMVVVPSRTEVGPYKDMKKDIDELAGKINGRFGSTGWTPILYLYKSLTFPELSALYNCSDVALVTPLRDGMNMISKEYVASRRDQSGVLILSEMAGAASELGEAILINPNHKEEVAAALQEALSQPLVIQVERNRLMQARLKRYDIVRWGNDFVRDLVEFKKEQVAKEQCKLAGAKIKGQIMKDFNRAKKRLILLDYDGTLVPFAKYPPLAYPSAKVLETLRRLVSLPDTKVVIISGRAKEEVERWLKPSGADISAEHGVWVKEGGKKWKMPKPLRCDWKDAAMPLIRTFVDRVPGSFLEEKEYALVWHYRMANPELASQRAKELTANLLNLASNMNAQVVPGNKIVEIRSSGTDKGSTALYFLEKQKYDFILSIGDDTTDEDMFKALPEQAYTIKVGTDQTAAKYIIDNPTEVLSFLDKLGRRSQVKRPEVQHIATKKL